MQTTSAPRASRAKALATVVLATALVSTPTLASPIEQEVDPTGVVGFVGLRYGVHTVNAGLASSFEVDGYTFAGTAGDQLRIAFHTLTGGLDPVFELYGPTNMALQTVSCGGKDGFGRFILCSNALDLALPATGVYTLNVSDNGADNAGAYQLHIDRHPPVNNWVGLGYGTDNEASDALGHTTDHDNFAFSALAGTGVRLTLRTTTTTGGVDPLMEVWGPTGAALSSTQCAGNDGFGRPILCTNTVNLDIGTSGIHTLALRDIGLDETGGYILSIHCRFGVCPVAAPVPVPVPEPAHWLLLTAGLAALAGVVRRRRTRSASTGAGA